MYFGQIRNKTKVLVCWTLFLERIEANLEFMDLKFKEIKQHCLILLYLLFYFP
jgi:hypothetical protein